MTHSMRAFIRVLAVASITCLLAVKAQAATCPPGQVEDFGGCSECRAGQFQTLDENQQAVCVDCPLMTFSDSGATKCQPCAPGTLTYYTGSSSCENCSVGFVPQFNNDTNYPSCEQCPDGTYTPRPGTAPCQACQGGSYISMSYDEMNCTKCPAGTAPHNTTHPDSCYSDAIDFCCPACEPGTFTATAGTLECQACPAGTFQPNSSATGCLPCPPGTYTNTTGNSACTPTDIGYYQDKSGQSTQVACPAGTVGLVSGGATQAAACFPYSTGRYSFTERQDRLSVLTIRSFGTNAAVQSLGRDATRVMDSGTSSGCGGQVYSLETYYMCSRYPLVDGVLEKSVCTSQPTSGPLSSDCLTYSFYALTNGSFAWVIHANNSNTPTSTCLLHPGQATTSCRFIEDVESTTYLAEYIYLGNVQQAAGQSTTNTQDIIAPGAQGSSSGGGSSSSSNSTKNGASLASVWASLRTLLPATAFGAALLLHTL